MIPTFPQVWTNGSGHKTGHFPSECLHLPPGLWMPFLQHGHTSLSSSPAVAFKWWQKASALTCAPSCSAFWSNLSSAINTTNATKTTSTPSFRCITWVYPVTSSEWLHFLDPEPQQLPRYEGKAWGHALFQALGTLAQGAVVSTECL